MSKTSYGHFDPKNQEYIIDRYDTPTPWINYISNGHYCSIISQTGGGFSFFGDPRDFRISRYRYGGVAPDRPGKYLYLKDRDSGTYWSLGWQPVQKKPQSFECRHGLGYTIIKSKTEDITSQATFFVPEEDCEIWLVRITNDSKQARHLDLTTYVEFSLRNALHEYLFYPNLKLFFQAHFDSQQNAIFYHQRHYNWHEMGRLFITASAKVNGFECDREKFLGHYRGEGNPQAIETSQFGGSTLNGGDGCGALNMSLTLAPGQSRTIVVILGAEKKDPAMVKRLQNKYFNVKNVEAALKKVKTDWQKYLDAFKIETPSLAANEMLNLWHPYQCKVAFDWSRFVSGYNTGTGRGIGFRDTSQDVMGVINFLPAKAAAKIKLLAKNTFKEGRSYHVFFPASGEGEPTKYADDHLWLVHAVYQYLMETGDLKILKDKVPYIDGQPSSLYDHLKGAVTYTLKNLGPHGLPKMFFADWNDCLNDICRKDRGEKGESVMAAMQLVLAAKQLAEMAELFGSKTEAKKFSDIARKMKDKINTIAWDGAWYVRAFTDAGKAIGSAKCAEGKIYLEPQAWSVISGVAYDEKNKEPWARGKTAMDSVYKLLNTKNGIKLLSPAYYSFPDNVGSLIHYPPGLKENAGVFCHANSWAIVAESILGRSDRAFRYYEQILPSAISQRLGQEKYAAEPYVYTQFVFGPDHQEFGRGSHSWLTGTASWTYLAFTQYLLGLRPTAQGLKIDPCLPKNWPGFTAQRIFRGARYLIKVTRQGHQGCGIKKILVDGQKTEGNILPVFKDKKEHLVKVTLS